MAKAKSQTIKTTNTTTKTKTVKYHQKKGSGNQNKCPVCGKFMKKGWVLLTEHIKTRKKLVNISSINEFNNILEFVILTDEEKYILQQHYLKGKNFACIADELGYAEITVNKKHCKILKKISKCMK